MKLTFSLFQRDPSRRVATRHGKIASPTASWYWSWGGASLGYRVSNSLFSPQGLEIGRFIGNELYGPDGKYLAETGLKGEGIQRLVRNRYKFSRTWRRFTPGTARSRADRPSLKPLPFYLGQDEFTPSVRRASEFAVTA